MSTKREPLLRPRQFRAIVKGVVTDALSCGGDEVTIAADMAAHAVRDYYEAARAKDAELIQRLVDALALTSDLMEVYAPGRCNGSGCLLCRAVDKAESALYAARRAGFKTSEP